MSSLKSSSSFPLLPDECQDVGKESFQFAVDGFSGKNTGVQRRMRTFSGHASQQCTLALSRAVY